MYLLDTTVWIDLLRTNSPAIRRKLVTHSGSRIGLSIVTLCELRYGLERRAIRHPHLRFREQHLLSAIVAPFDIVPLDGTSHRLLWKDARGSREFRQDYWRAGYPHSGTGA